MHGTRKPSIQALRVLSAALRVIAFMDVTDATIPTFSFRNVCASWKESSCADASATTRLASGVARVSPATHPSFPSARRQTPALGAYG